MDCEQIKQGITEFLTEYHLPILNPDFPISGYQVLTAFRSHGVRLGVQMRFFPNRKVMTMIVYFPNQDPIERDKYSFQILNAFYAKILLSHFVFLRDGGGITLRSGYVLMDGKFDKKRFKEHFHQIVHDAVYYYPQLMKLLAERATNA